MDEHSPHMMSPFQSYRKRRGLHVVEDRSGVEAIDYPFLLRSSPLNLFLTSSRLSNE
uniref:Uncharacterized protein n=1 Tax=Lepeophtheirus salmonis TaxID=72036 RepID=A0A0K2TY59_LEPSM